MSEIRCADSNYRLIVKPQLYPFSQRTYSEPELGVTLI